MRDPHPTPRHPRRPRGPYRTPSAPVGTALAAAVLLAGGAAAQAPLSGVDPDAPPPGPGVSFSTSTGVTRLADRWSGTATGTVLVRIHRGVRLGGSASVLLRNVSGGILPTGEAGRLEMAYGGVRTEVDLPLAGVSIDLLLGGGHATLTDPVVGTRVDADSFVVVEPGATLALPAAGPLLVEARGGYRWVDGTGGLPGVPATLFRGPVLAIGLELGL